MFFASCASAPKGNSGANDELVKAEQSFNRQEYSEAILHYEKAAELGYADAQSALERLSEISE